MASPGARVPHPDFRYVALSHVQRRPWWRAPWWPPVFGVSAFAISDSPWACASIAAGVVAAQIVAAALGGGHASERTVMAIVPWGVVVEAEGTARVLHWPAVRHIDVKAWHRMRGGTPEIVSSVVTVHVDGQTLTGHAPGSVGLETLLAHLKSYQREAARPSASDWEGRVWDRSEPSVEALWSTAYDLVARHPLSGHGGGYYRHAALHDDTHWGDRFRQVLRNAPHDDAPSDLRPLAALVAGCSAERSLATDLLRLTNSPHPLVAGCSRAAALRLGAPKRRTGSISEVAPFLFGEDVDLLTAFATGQDMPMRARAA